MFKKFIKKLNLQNPVQLENDEYLLEQKYEEFEFFAWDYARHELER